MGSDRSGPSATVGSFEGHASLTLRAGSTAFVVAPELGLLGVSLTDDGDEFLDLVHPPEAVLDGHTTGLPLLAPWANRLRDSYDIDGVAVSLADAPIHRDGSGVAIHGVMLGRSGWELDSVRSTASGVAARFSFDMGAADDVMAVFPFPHRLTVEFVVEPHQLRVTTTVHAGASRVPVSFGWHPYFRIPGATRAQFRLELPDRRRVIVDDRMLPTGRTTTESAEATSLVDRSFDDGYRLGRDRTFRLSAGARALAIAFERGYPVGQVYSPPGADFVAIEPMTAVTDALATGSTPMVESGRSRAARFAITLA